ncbi:MAG: YdcF family protein [Chitinophagaceae bacterium]|nr:YdcF family protein [Chitinophagaceae bacterium]
MFPSFLKILFVFCVLATTTLLSGCSSFFNPEKQYASVVKDAPFDVIIVPGFPHEKNNWSIVVKSRVYWAVYLYQKGITKNIIFSGAAVYTPYVEGEVMALYAKQLGVPSNHIFIETKAEHSCENLFYSYQLAKQKRFHSIAVATDAVQCNLLKKFRRKFHLYDIKFIPIIYDDIKINEKPNPSLNVDTACVRDFISIRKRENFLKRYRGTQGLKVKQLMRKNRQQCFQEGNVSVKQSKLELSHNCNPMISFLRIY